MSRWLSALDLTGLYTCSVSGSDLPHGLFKVYGVLYRAPGELSCIKKHCTVSVLRTPVASL